MCCKAICTVSGLIVIAVICLLKHPRVIACFFFLAHRLINDAADEIGVRELRRKSATDFLFVVFFARVGELCRLCVEHEFKLDPFHGEMPKKGQMGT